MAQAYPDESNLRTEDHSLVQRPGGIVSLRAQFGREFDSRVQFSVAKRPEKSGGRTEEVSRPRNEPSEAYKLSRVPGQKPDGFVPLRHWSNLDLSNRLIDPKFQTGSGAEGARLRDYPKQYIRRSYFGLSGYKKEASLGNNLHEVQIHASKLYNRNGDPLNLYEQAVACWRPSSTKRRTSSSLEL